MATRASVPDPYANLKAWWLIVFVVLQLSALYSSRISTIWDLAVHTAYSLLMASMMAFIMTVVICGQYYAEKTNGCLMETGETIHDYPDRMGKAAAMRVGARQIDLQPLSLPHSPLVLETCQSEMTLRQNTRVTQASLEIAVINALRAYTIHIASTTTTTEKCT